MNNQDDDREPEYQPEPELIPVETEREKNKPYAVWYMERLTEFDAVIARIKQRRMAREPDSN